MSVVVLFIDVFGARPFGRVIVSLLVVTVACTLATMASFFQDYEYTQYYVYNATDPSQCTKPADNNTAPNCTKVAEGRFIGIGAASGKGNNFNFLIAHRFTNYKYEFAVGDLERNFEENLQPRYEFDCSHSGLDLSFATVIQAGNKFWKKKC